MSFSSGVPGGLPTPIAVTTVAATSRTLRRADNGTLLYFTAGSAVTLTVPAGLGRGFNCLIVQGGAGAVTPTASGTTIENRSSFTETAGQYALCTLVAVAVDTFIFAGDGA